MKRVLVISSQVAASSVGANNSAFCLRRLGVETVILPTTLYGRHPGWGSPGGQVMPTQIMLEMWSGIKAQNLEFDAVLSGYMSSIETVNLTSEIINNIKTKNPKTTIIVDPVMGDHGKLYVPIPVAQAILRNLISHADIITPNVWEFSYLMQREMPDLQHLRAALMDYGGCALVTSVEHEGRIGALSYHPKGRTYIGHDKFDHVPNGGGDALAGIFLAHLLRGRSEEAAAQIAVSSIFEIMKESVSVKSAEFPLTEHQALLEELPLLDMNRI